MGAMLLHAVSRSNRFLAASVLKLMNSQVTISCQHILTLICNLKVLDLWNETSWFGG